MIMLPFDTVFAEFAHTFSGVVLVTDTSGVVFSAVSGLANRDFNIPNDMDTLFDTASVTKTFTAAAIIKLVEEGALHLEDRVTRIVDLSGTKIPDDVTVEHLLTHTSGIADDADEEAGEDYSALFEDKPNYAIRNCIDFLPQFAYKDPVFAAGTQVRYNNCAFVLLGLAIEKVTGTDCRTFITEQVFKPNGMKNTHFYAKDEICPHVAEGYFPVKNADGEIVKWKKNIYSYPPVGTPDGGAFTTAGDLDLFVRAMKRNPRMMQPHSPFTRDSKYGTWRTGYAFEFIEAKGEIVCMYKEGGNAGVDAILSFYPARDTTLVILSNENGCLWDMYGKMQELIFSTKI